MWYYNKNVITKMKIKKSEFISNFTATKNPEQYIKQVVKLFQQTIKNRELNVQIIRKNNLKDIVLKADWKNY